MEKRNDTHVQTMLPEIKAMPAEGETRQDAAEQAYKIQSLQSGVAALQRPGISVYLLMYTALLQIVTVTGQ